MDDKQNYSAGSDMAPQNLNKFSNQYIKTNHTLHSHTTINRKLAKLR